MDGEVAGQRSGGISELLQCPRGQTMGPKWVRAASKEWLCWPWPHGGARGKPPWAWKGIPGSVGEIKVYRGWVISHP